MIVITHSLKSGAALDQQQVRHVTGHRLAVDCPCGPKVQARPEGGLRIQHGLLPKPEATRREEDYR